MAHAMKELHMKELQLTVHESGAAHGPTVLFLHGFPFTRTLWRSQVDELSSEFRCVWYDLRGFGENAVTAGSADRRTANPRTPDPLNSCGLTTIEGHVDDLLDIVARLKKSAASAHGRAARVILCGHSLGAHVAMRAMERAPQQVAALAICGAHAGAPSDQERIAVAELIRAIARSGVRQFASRYLAGCFTRESRDAGGGYYDEALEQSESMAPLALQGALLAMAARTATLKFLEETTPPVLIVSGAEDNLVPSEALIRMGLGITGAQFVRVPHAAHAAPLENPEFVTTALRRFFRSALDQAEPGQ